MNGPGGRVLSRAPSPPCLAGSSGGGPEVVSLSSGSGSQGSFPPALQAPWRWPVLL